MWLRVHPGVSYFNAMRTGNGFNKMSTGNGFNKVIRRGKYCLKQLEHAFGWNLMFAACVWDLQHNSVTQVVLINHKVKYFAKENSTFTIFLHRRHGRFIVYQFKTVSLFSNQDSKVTKYIPYSSSSSSSVTSPSPDSIALNDRVKRALPFHR